MSAEEATILAPFRARAEAGELVESSEIAKAYQSAVDHPISTGRIYFVLHRLGWRKVMPRSKRPKKASEEEIAASKKFTPQSKT
ncbi:winged helix-turn-helix domain-containing protein [Oscillibacter sp. 1-3]|mgnify:CR=1 FL=1|uniref:winged helix-turn-helix domain-containing protein n=1 Tax=Oscillibacter sp. 1-3 TaxID=1235797 RepID=UPI0003AA307B|nr:winged helix-turn-helix domain-containing protein [Oscillibacter sp. 1-3]